MKYEVNEPKITFVVPVYGTSGIWLPRCLDSLLDNQDYENKSVIVVFDGKNNQSQKALSQEDEYRDDNQVTFIHLDENKGAPHARNAGLDLVNKRGGSEYICFFDCDSMLTAGAIRIWVKAFEDNPECGFVYGGYRFRMDKGQFSYMPAKPFDRWLLTCNNYISTMNPIKVSICPRWDEDVPSLQDWDFWLRATVDGTIGFYIRDYLVITEESDKAENISQKSHKDWENIYQVIRDKNGIPDRKVAIASIGAEFQAIRRSKYLGADYRDPQMLVLKPHHYKAIISMGFYVQSEYGPYYVFARANGSKKIVHFIGTDVLQLQCLKFLEVKAFSKSIKNSVDKVLCNAPWLKDELEEMGVESELLYCPIESSKYVSKPFPNKFTIAYYYSDSNPLHNWNFIVDMTLKTPDIEWKFFGGEKKIFKDLPENVELMGRIPEHKIPEFIASTSMILRITLHDGFPASLAEWAMSCRPFVCNIKDMPFGRFVDAFPQKITNYVKSIERVYDKIRKVQKALHRDTEWKELEIAKKYYGRLLEPEKYKKRMNEICEV